MRELVKEFRKLMIIFTVVVAVITYICIYLPIKTELQDRTLDNFVLATQQGEREIDFFVIQCMDNTEKLSKNTLLKHEIANYKAGKTSREEMLKFTTRIYTESILESNAKASFRVIEGIVLNSYNKELLKDVPKVSIVYKLYYQIHLINGLRTVLVYSPIIVQDNVIGYDLVLYDLSEIIKNMEKDRVEITIIDTAEANQIKKLNIKERKVRDMVLQDDGTHTYYVNAIANQDFYYYVKIDNVLLYQSIRKVTARNIISFSISILLLVLLTNGITMQLAKRILLKTERSKAKYKEYATRDSLTGIYSRFFFERLIKEWLKNPELNEDLLTVVMVDIDYFKKINDTYGHNMGDKAVILVANTIRTSLREGDYVIRYGGDEFLILMKNVDEVVVEGIMGRIVTRLEHLEELGFPISISYGIQESRNLKEIYKTIEQADERMYQLKKMKQSTRQAE